MLTQERALDKAFCEKEKGSRGDEGWDKISWGRPAYPLLGAVAKMAQSGLGEMFGLGERVLNREASVPGSRRPHMANWLLGIISQP